MLTSTPATVRSTVHTHATRIESRAIMVAAGAFILSALTALIVMRGITLPLWKDLSVGVLAILAGSVVGAAAYVLSAYDTRSRNAATTGVKLRLLRFAWDTAALTFTHVAVFAMLCLVLFSTLQDAFLGLEVDALTGMVLVGVAGAACGYFLYLSASSMTAYKMSSLLAVFLSSGVLLSMTTASDPDWWHANFSSLGTTTDISGFAFNATLTIAGATITILADYLTNDLMRWTAQQRGEATAHISVVKWALVTIGIMLAFVGLVPVDEILLIHNIAASGMVVVFFALMIGLRKLVPGYPETFFVLSYGFLAAIIIAAVMFFPVGYYNLTAFELISAALIFTWLVIFVRNTAAVTADAESP
ncbi:hypothetical protein [Leifsonia sp. A12D58]|uniref:hypothetical protein n=1 Tax=Leifsonia sp. A12D58 TaxID=3397674 RepID=UPI0039E02EFE